MARIPPKARPGYDRSKARPLAKLTREVERAYLWCVDNPYKNGVVSIPEGQNDNRRVITEKVLYLKHRGYIPDRKFYVEPQGHRRYAIINITA